MSHSVYEFRAIRGRALDGLPDYSTLNGGSTLLVLLASTADWMSIDEVDRELARDFESNAAPRTRLGSQMKALMATLFAATGDSESRTAARRELEWAHKCRLALQPSDDSGDDNARMPTARFHFRYLLRNGWVQRRLRFCASLQILSRGGSLEDKTLGFALGVDKALLEVDPFAPLPRPLRTIVVDFLRPTMQLFQFEESGFGRVSPRPTPPGLRQPDRTAPPRVPEPLPAAGAPDAAAADATDASLDPLDACIANVDAVRTRQAERGSLVLGTASLDDHVEMAEDGSFARAVLSHFAGFRAVAPLSTIGDCLAFTLRAERNREGGEKLPVYDLGTSLETEASVRAPGPRPLFRTRAEFAAMKREGVKVALPDGTRGWLSHVDGSPSERITETFGAKTTRWRKGLRICFQFARISHDQVRVCFRFIGPDTGGDNCTENGGWTIVKTYQTTHLAVFPTVWIRCANPRLDSVARAVAVRLSVGDFSLGAIRSASTQETVPKDLPKSSHPNHPNHPNHPILGASISSSSAACDGVSLIHKGASTTSFSGLASFSSSIASATPFPADPQNGVPPTSDPEGKVGQKRRTRADETDTSSPSPAVSGSPSAAPPSSQSSASEITRPATARPAKRAR